MRKEAVKDTEVLEENPQETTAVLEEDPQEIVAESVPEKAVLEPNAASRELTVSEREESQLSFDEQVIERITAMTLREIGGVMVVSGGGGFFNLKANKGIGIKIEEDMGVLIAIDVAIEYGRSAPEIFELIKEKLASQVKLMCGLDVKRVNVRVVNILSTEEFGEHQES